MDDELKQQLGMLAGGTGGFLTFAKIGVGAALALAGVPVIGPPLALLTVLGAPVAGAIYGARFGKKNPGMAAVSAAIGVFGVPGLHGDAAGAAGAVAEGVTQNLPS
jgi:hypothetical protein